MTEAFNALNPDHVARKIAMARINDFRRSLDFPANTYRARLPILQDGIYAKAPYFEIAGISGVSTSRPNAQDYEKAAKAIEFRKSKEFGEDNR